MKLITFQTKEALLSLEKTGILMTDSSYLDMKKCTIPYNWIIEQMYKQKIRPLNGEQYPIWAWVKCAKSIAPPKRRNYFQTHQKKIIKITFEKPDNEVLLSDYMAYSFILSGHIVPKTVIEYQEFLQNVQKDGISLDCLKKFVRGEKIDKKTEKLFIQIEKTWPKIFILKSNIWQACVWNIKLSEITKLETLNDANYLYGTMNAKRSDGSRPNWKEKYLQFLSD